MPSCITCSTSHSSAGVWIFPQLPTSDARSSTTSSTIVTSLSWMSSGSLRSRAPAKQQDVTLCPPWSPVQLSSVFSWHETCYVPACFKTSTIIPSIVPKKPRIIGLNDLQIQRPDFSCNYHLSALCCPTSKAQFSLFHHDPNCSWSHQQGPWPLEH